MSERIIAQLQTRGRKWTRENQRQLGVQKVEAEAAARKQHRREQVRADRTESFEALNTRNLEIGTKIEGIIALGKKFPEPFQSQMFADGPWVVLREGGDDTDWVAGFMRHHKKTGKSLDEFGYERYSVEVYVTDKESVHRIRQNPRGTLHAKTELAGPDPAIESTYLIARADSEQTDEIMQTAFRTIPDRQIAPIDIMRTYFCRRQIARHLDNLDATVAIFEEAITDPVLNPHLT